MRRFFFVAQTGTISDRAPSYSNYYVYNLPEECRAQVEAAVEAANISSCGIEYPREFLQWLQAVDRLQRIPKCLLHVTYLTIESDGSVTRGGGSQIPSR